jgi:hypothetical protein
MPPWSVEEMLADLHQSGWSAGFHSTPSRYGVAQEWLRMRASHVLHDLDPIRAFPGFGYDARYGRRL